MHVLVWPGYLVDRHFQQWQHIKLEITVSVFPPNNARRTCEQWSGDVGHVMFMNHVEQAAK